MQRSKKNSERDTDTDMAKESSVKDATVRDLTASFLKILENGDVVSKHSVTLSASIQLMLDEKVDHVNKKLDKIIQDNKSLLDRMAIIERENDKLKYLNAGLQTDVDNMSMKINQLEQGVRRNTLLIMGVSETFAERVTDGGNAENPPQNFREGTINTVCAVIKEA